MVGRHTMPRREARMSFPAKWKGEGNGRSWNIFPCGAGGLTVKHGRRCPHPGVGPTSSEWKRAFACPIFWFGRDCRVIPRTLAPKALSETHGACEVTPRNSVRIPSPRGPRHENGDTPPCGVRGSKAVQLDPSYGSSRSSSQSRISHLRALFVRGVILTKAVQLDPSYGSSRSSSQSRISHLRALFVRGVILKRSSGR